MWSSERSNNVRRGLIAVLSVVAAIAALAVFTVPGATAESGPTPDIIGGTEVPDDPDLWPFMAAILDSSDPESQFCGGALVAQRWVLTTRTCAEAAESLHVLVGRKSLTGSGGAVIKAATTIVHGGFDDEFFANNLAMIYLSQAAPAPAAPVDLAELTDATTYGDELQIAGWGSTDRAGANWPTDLQEAAVEVSDFCPYETGYWGPHFCAAHFEGTDDSLSRDICYGDVGGPAVRLESDNPILMGIANWGLECATSPFASVWVDVRGSRQWINSVLANSTSPNVGKVDFDPTLVGNSSSKTVVVSNLGTQTTTVSGAWVDEQVRPIFEIARDGCSGQPMPPGGSCEIEVKFTPNVWPFSIYTARLNIGSESPNLGSVVQLSGAASGLVRGDVFFGIGFPNRAKKAKWVKRGRNSSAVIDVKVWRTAHGYFTVPAAAECNGPVTVRTKIRGIRRTFKSTTSARMVKFDCVAPIRLTVPKRPKRLLATFTISFPGNSQLQPAARVVQRRIR